MQQYNVIGTVECGEQTFDILDVPMMSAEREHAIARTQAVKRLTEQDIEPTEENMRRYWQSISEERAQIHGTPTYIPSYSFDYTQKKKPFTSSTNHSIRK